MRVKNNDENLPNRIRELREQRRLTLKHLAAEIGIAFGHLQRMEVGKRDLPLRRMRTIGAALGVQPCDILSPHDGALSQAERHLVEAYRSANPQVKAMLDALLEQTPTDTKI